jgi:hypothetical protein
MKEIKIGDTVKCITTNVESIVNGKYNGKTGIVVDMYDGSYPYQLDFNDGYTLWCKAEPLTPETQSGGFKVGDRVDFISSRSATIPGTVLAVGKDEIRVRWDVVNGQGGITDSYHYTRLKHINKESTMPTYKDDKYEYTALKSLSPESVLKGSPCKGEFANYVSEFGGQYFFIDIPIEEVVERSKLYPAWLPWLKSHGYVGVKEIKKEKKKEVIKDVHFADISFIDGGYRATPYINDGENEDCNKIFKRFISKGNLTMTLEWYE